MANARAAARQVTTHPAWTAASTAGVGASRPRLENSFSSQQRIRWVVFSWQVRHVEAEVLHLVEPADVHLVAISVRLEPRKSRRDRLVIRPQVKN